MRYTLEQLIEIRELEISVLKILKEIDKEIRVSKLIKTFKYHPYISESLFEQIGKKLKYEPNKLKEAYRLFKNNGDYVASHYDKEDGI